MKIAIVGASASGIYLALDLLEKHPNLQVVLFDQEEKLGKKISATGNGRCNILHDHPSIEKYDHPEIIEACLKRFPFEKLKATLEGYGIPLRREGDLYYPLCNSAPGLVRYLGQSLESLGATLKLGVKILDYIPSSNGVLLKTSKGDERFDYCVFAVGAKSGKNLGSDGSMFPVFERHGYDIVPFRPGLAPIRTEERHPSLQGIRLDGKVSIDCQGHHFEEEGQILFKKDGLSGIVIFNAESFLAQHHAKKGTEITLDAFPNYDVDALAKMFDKDAKRSHFLQAYFPLELGRFLEPIAKKGSRALAEKLKAWKFHFFEPYPFADSQVSLGGLSWSQIKVDTGASSFESRVFFAGECLDMAGACGGYNLTWCLISSLIVSEAFDEILR